MRAAGLWARAEVRRSWPSLLVLAVLAGLACGVVVATAAGAARAGSAVDRFEAATRAAHVTLFTEDRLGGGVRKALDEDPRVEARATIEVVGAAPKGSVPGLEAVTAVGVDLGGTQFRPWLIEGRLPRRGEPDAIAVSELTSRYQGYAVGDEIEMEYFDPATAIACREGDADACRSRLTAGRVRIVGIARTTTDLASHSFRQGLLFASDAFRDRLGEEPPTIGHIESVRLRRAGDAADVAAEYSLMRRRRRRRAECDG